MTSSFNVLKVGWVLVLAVGFLSASLFIFAPEGSAQSFPPRPAFEIVDAASPSAEIAASSCLSLTDISLLAPRRAVTDTVHRLQASVMPTTARQPITYHWRATAQSPVTQVGGVTDTTAFTWTLTGPKWVTVTAENICGAVVSESREIILQDSFRVYLPFVSRPLNACQPIPEAAYTAIVVVDGQPPSPDAAHDPGFNVNLLEAVPVSELNGLVDYAGGVDPQAPQLAYLFGDQRIPTFSEVYALYDQGHSASIYPVSMAGFEVEPLEIIRVPDRFKSGDGVVNIDPRGYKVLVLYASRQSITLKYSREDGLGGGYTVHIADICVEPSLLALYEQKDAEGRGYLPALFGQQALGRAWGQEIRVAIRDQGAIMDPRSRKDWWQYP